MRFQVHVQSDDDQSLAAGKHVAIYFTAMLRGYISTYGDDDGLAEFDEDVAPGEAIIQVDGQDFGPYEIYDGADFTVNI
jgi:hypothetical protein